MRVTNVILLGSVFLSSLVLAEPEESPAARAARLAAADDTGSLRENQLSGPTIDSRNIVEGNATEHAPVADEDTRAATPVSGVLEELVARQMAHNQIAFDRCVTDAKKRDATVHGDVEMQITVAQKHASAVVTTSNAKLGVCLVAAAKAMRVSLPDTHFPWKVSLGTQPAGATKSTLR